MDPDDATALQQVQQDEERWHDSVNKRQDNKIVPAHAEIMDSILPPGAGLKNKAAVLGNMIQENLRRKKIKWSHYSSWI